MNEKKADTIAEIFAKHLKNSSSQEIAEEILLKLDDFIQQEEPPKDFLARIRRQHLATERAVPQDSTRLERKIASINADKLYQLDMLVQQLLEARIAASGG